MKNIKLDTSNNTSNGVIKSIDYYTIISSFIKLFPSYNVQFYTINQELCCSRCWDDRLYFIIITDKANNYIYNYCTHCADVDIALNKKYNNLFRNVTGFNHNSYFS
jgi:hypothetical protein